MQQTSCTEVSDSFAGNPVPRSPMPGDGAMHPWTARDCHTCRCLLVRIRCGFSKYFYPTARKLRWEQRVVRSASRRTVFGAGAKPFSLPCLGWCGYPGCRPVWLQTAVLNSGSLLSGFGIFMSHKGSDANEVLPSCYDPPEGMWNAWCCDGGYGGMCG